MDRKRKALVLFALGIAILLPALAYAQSGIPTGAGGLVPCGVVSGVENPTAAVECQACHLVELTQNVINFLVGIAISVAVLMVAWAGFLYFTSGAKPENINRGKRIFGQTLFGFIIAIGAWIIINTLLLTLLDRKQYIQEGSWFNIECVAPQSRPINASLSDIIRDSIGVVNLPSDRDIFTLTDAEGNTQQYQCPTPGFTYNPAEGVCMNEEGDMEDYTQYVPPSPVNVGVGNCSPSALENTWGADATVMSCIAYGESACVAGRLSQSDMTADNYSFSAGMYQINLTVHDLNTPACTALNGGQPLNCTNAFSGSNYNAKVIDPSLYQRCIAAASNVSCNTAEAQRIRNSQGLSAWGAYTRPGGCSGR